MKLLYKANKQTNFIILETVLNSHPHKKLQYNILWSVSQKHYKQTWFS